MISCDVCLPEERSEVIALLSALQFNGKRGNRGALSTRINREEEGEKALLRGLIAEVDESSEVIPQR